MRICSCIFDQLIPDNTYTRERRYKTFMQEIVIIEIEKIHKKRRKMKNTT